VFHCEITLVCIAVLNRKPVEELLERLFSSWDAVTGAKHIKQLCLDKPVSFKPMHSHVHFVTGNCGGMEVVVTDGNELVNARCFDQLIELVFHVPLNPD